MTQNFDCIFCKIIANQIPATILHETDTTIMIKDIYPKAPIHNLIISKKHISNISAADESNSNTLAGLLLTAKDFAKKQNISDFRLITNNGKNAGQSVFHLHFHFLAGKQMVDF